MQAAWIRNSILRALETTGTPSSALSPSFVYQAPSVTALSAAISRATTSAEDVPSEETRAQELLDLVARFTAHFPARSTTLRKRASSYDVVLLTGSTGGFGCHILAELVTDTSVEKIYVLNRGAGSRQRQADAMLKHGVEIEWLLSPKIRFLEGELNERFFGLGEELYREVNTLGLFTRRVG